MGDMLQLLQKKVRNMSQYQALSNEPSNGVTSLDRTASQQVMELSYTGYVMYHDVISRKLKHAQTATKCSLHETRCRKEADAIEVNSAELADLKKYDAFWQTIIDNFRNTFLPEAELKRIDAILGSLPQMIVKFYNILVGQDSILQKLLNELKNEKYTKANEAIAAVQSKTCALSGLEPDEFNLPGEKPLTAEDDGSRAYKIKIPGSTRRTKA